MYMNYNIVQIHQLFNEFENKTIVAYTFFLKATFKLQGRK